MKKYTLEFGSILLVTTFLLATVQAVSALTLTFTNPSSITIPLAGTATPYPAIINVSGVSGPITDLNVTLNGLSHTFINDVGALLVGPGGQSVVLFDGVGGTTGVANVTLVFDDQATQNLPSGLITSGSYKPTNLITSPPDVFPPPAPGLPYGSLLSVFNNTNPNGAWRLFVNDFAIPDGGSIAGGFGLQVTIVPEPASLLLLVLGFFPAAAWLRRKSNSS
jgi:subtilisin-like proprotein convertase family protein